MSSAVNSPLACRIFRVFTGALGLMLLVGCEAAPPYLKSHPSWEMFPRASSPPPDCPGQYRIAVANHSGDFFLGCWGAKTEGLDAGPAMTAENTKVRDLGR